MYKLYESSSGKILFERSYSNFFFLCKFDQFCTILVSVYLRSVKENGKLVNFDPKRIKTTVVETVKRNSKHPLSEKELGVTTW